MKANRKCLNCLPSRRSQCSNTEQPLASPGTSAEAHVNLPPCNSPEPSESPSSDAFGITLPVGDKSYHPGLDSPDDENVFPVSVLPNAHPLPPPQPMSNSSFVWGSLDGASFAHSVDAAYSEVIHWKQNTFTIPYGKVGKRFVLELSKLYRAYAEGSALESIALKSTTVMSALLLQKPAQKSKAKELCSCLEQRLNSWVEGDFNSLILEGRQLQSRLSRRAVPGKSGEDDGLARSFANLMFNGKINAALKLLSQKGKGGILQIKQRVDSSDPNSSPTVLESLKSKHPAAKPASSNALPTESCEPPQIHPVVYDSIDASTIRSAALNTKGSAGPSGLDAHCWRRLCTAFNSASQDLCYSLALLSRRLWTTLVDPCGLSALLACRLIALDKCPGVRPIGVCETARRIISKAILAVTKDDLQEAAGPLQLCAGQIAGIEAAIHAMRDSFHDEGVEAVLLVDASNAFNSLNRNAALLNIRFTCLTLATVLINVYRNSTELVVDKFLLASEEGTTQGDPLAMPMYALATIPLIHQLRSKVSDTVQIWYADDVATSGKLTSLRKWWDNLTHLGTPFGYYANASKTWLIVKGPALTQARDIFGDTHINITSEGRPYLGAALGSEKYINQFVSDKVQEWNEELHILSAIAPTQPHAAFAAFIHGFIHKFRFLCRVIPNINHLLQPLEDCIQCKLIPALTGRDSLDNLIRDLLALPKRLGGIGLVNPTTLACTEYAASCHVSGPLRNAIIAQEGQYSFQCWENQMNAKREVHKESRDRAKSSSIALIRNAPCSLTRAMDCALEKGASSWLTAFPWRSSISPCTKGLLGMRLP